MRSKSYVFLLIVLGLAGLSGFLYTKTKYNYGLDVRGGMRFTFEMDKSKLTAEQRAEIASVRANMQRILTNRVTSGLGVVEGTVQYKDPDQFIIELPGATDENEARKLLSTTASIEWYHARNVVNKSQPYNQYEEGKTETVNGSPAVTFVKRGDTNGKEIKPGDPEYQRIIDGWGEPIIKGDELAKAEAIPLGDTYMPSMNFSAAGARKIEDWTRKNQFLGSKLAAVLDGVVLNIAPLKEGAIIRESAQIDGTFEKQYVLSLVNLLNSGSLPVSLKELESSRVDPTIGQTALDMIIKAGLISFGVILLFLLIYYVFPGFVASIALLLYILFSLTVLKLIGATFSLAAIAGFILSVGMAVDANILVFERFKEEMREGRTLMQAIELGFRRALPAIIDSNICTILTSMVLANLGTGPVKGFASTLIIGVALSLFTAITVTRSLLIFLVGSGIGTNEKSYGLGRNWFGESLEATAESKPLQVMQRLKLYFGISLAMIIPGLIFLGMGGLKPNVEFQEGYEAAFLVRGNEANGKQVIENLERAGIKGANVKFGEAKGARQMILTIPQTEELRAMDVSAARAKIKEATGMADEPVGFTSVGPQIRDETYRNAVLGVIFSSALIVLYLAIRFGFALGGFVIGLRFAFSAILAMLHDGAIVLGLAAISGYFLGWEVSSLFITAMLTVIGFSTHDTIVIFDRIRENLRRKKRGQDFETLINVSITQSLARSINTSFTVLITLAILIFMGSATPDLKLFNLAMLIGIAAGTYSSIFNAAPILFLWDKMAIKSKGEEAGIVYQVEQEFARQRMVAAQVDAPTPSAAAPGSAAGYGQVKRRSSAREQGTREIDGP